MINVIGSSAYFNYGITRCPISIVWEEYKLTSSGDLLMSDTVFRELQSIEKRDFHGS